MKQAVLAKPARESVKLCDKPAFFSFNFLVPKVLETGSLRAVWISSAAWMKSHSQSKIEADRKQEKKKRKKQVMVKGDWSAVDDFESNTKRICHVLLNQFQALLNN